tara:strand:+ start:1711 stop:2331 length:621 start_codon:yes stop_codon:yes gene_type:complete
MLKQKLEVPIAINKMAEHLDIKEKCLSLINQSPGKRIKYAEGNLDITKGDYAIDGVKLTNDDPSRKWLQFLKPYLLNVVTDTYKNLGYDTFKIYNIWYQQYKSGSVHGWHVHPGCQWTSIYYLDLPDTAPKTQIVSPWDQQTIIKLDVQEGDVITFPSFAIHQAPENENNKTRTIISFNSDSDIDHGGRNIRGFDAKVRTLGDINV